MRELDGAAAAIRAIHSELLAINESKDRKKLGALRKRLGEDNLEMLPRYCLCLFSEEFPAPDDSATAPDEPGLRGAWRDFYLALSTTVSAGLPVRNRMRRLIHPVTFIELAEMLNAAREGTIVQWDRLSQLEA